MLTRFMSTVNFRQLSSVWTGGGQRRYFRIPIAITLVLAITASLWFASPVPVKAVDVTLPDLPSIMYRGYLHTFYAQVDINSNEQLPVTNLRIDITGGSGTTTYAVFNIDGSITEQSGHFYSITRVVSPYYSYGYRYGYGYGYQPTSGYGYFSQSWGYGYGYGYGYHSSLTTQAKYLISLYTANMTLGSYTAQLSVNTGPGETKYLSPEYSFTLAAPGGGGGGGGGAPPPPTEASGVGEVNLTLYLDDQGMTTATITLSSNDGRVTIIIPEGTKMLDADGNPLGSIQIIVLNTPPPPPDYAMVGPAYDCLPAGATFEPTLPLTFGYDTVDLPAGVSENDLVMAYWDGDKWVMLSTTVDTQAKTVTGQVAHFTAFAILAKLPPSPATFAITDLTLSPAEAIIGEKVTITALVTNSGDLSGSYDIVLKLNGVTLATEEITLDAGTSQEVTFTTTKNRPGTYTVDINGLTEKLIVKLPAVFEMSQLSILPTEVRAGETVTIEAAVTNVSQTTDSYSLSLKVNGAVEATKEVTLNAGEETTVTFQLTPDMAGIYEVDINGLTGTFTVTGAPVGWWFWLSVGVVAAAIAGGLVSWQLRRRKL